jgi:hypothetical protein
MRKKILWGLGGFVTFIAAVAIPLYLSAPLRDYAFFAPFKHFDPSDALPTPDYTEDESWAALPGEPSAAAQVPVGIDGKNEEATAGFDVFFIPPTTFFGRRAWNAHFAEGGVTKRLLEDGVLRYQASVFNGCCRVFAPRYRQATLYAFMGKGADENAALDLAYQDVLRAFNEFLAQRNAGRPFILAGHSQGSLHGMRLLQDHIAGTPLADRMVAAYLIGFSIPIDMALPGGIGPCRGPTETRCYISWNSVAPNADARIWRQTSTIWLDHRYQLIGGRKITCVNPLSWQLDGTAPAAANLGSLAFARGGSPMPPRLHATGAACVDGVLDVTPPMDDPGFTYGVRGGIYHIHDYNLFYLNLRANLAARTAAFAIR